MKLEGKNRAYRVIIEAHISVKSVDVRRIPELELYVYPSLDSLVCEVCGLKIVFSFIKLKLKLFLCIFQCLVP